MILLFYNFTRHLKKSYTKLYSFFKLITVEYNLSCFSGIENATYEMLKLEIDIIGNYGLIFLLVFACTVSAVAQCQQHAAQCQKHA